MRAAIYARQSAGKAKSIKEQLSLGHTVIGRENWQHWGDFKDGTSASRYATKPRGGWNEVRAEIAEGSFDVLVLWETSRGDRTPETWFAFLSSCRENRVQVYVIKDERLYDMTKPRDWKTLAEDGVNNAYESDMLSLRTARGHAGAAMQGLPPGGPTPYGYKRNFDPNTGKRLGQVVKEPEASIVREIFERLAKGVGVLTIAMDLNRRQIPPAAAQHWLPHAIRRIARNPVYIGLRAHKGQEHKGQWEPIVTKEAFYAVQQFLDEPERRITRPAKQTHLLSYLARCGVCGEFMYVGTGAYRCLVGCVSLMESEMDEVVTEVVILRLMEPDALQAMSQGDDHEAAMAERESERLQARLHEFRFSAAQGETSPATLAVVEKKLLAQISELNKKANMAGLPLVLKDFLSPEADVRKLWSEATLTARRQVVKSLCEIRVGRGIAGRSSSIVRRQRTRHRLQGSKWVGDERTWGDYWT